MIGGHNAALAIKILCFLGSLPTPEKSHKPFSSHHEMLAVRGKMKGARCRFDLPERVRQAFRSYLPPSMRT